MTISRVRPRLRMNLMGERVKDQDSEERNP